MLHEMLRINETINYVLDWAKGRDDTLIIVTADHETGGFGFSYAGSNIPKGKKLPNSLFKDKEFRGNFNFGATNILDKLYNQKMSYKNIFKIFDKLEKSKQNAKSLMNIVNNNTDFPITEIQAKRVLSEHANPVYINTQKDYAQQMINEYKKLRLKLRMFFPNLLIWMILNIGLRMNPTLLNKRFI